MNQLLSANPDGFFVIYIWQQSQIFYTNLRHLNDFYFRGHSQILMNKSG